MLRPFHRLLAGGILVASTLTGQPTWTEPSEPGLAFVTSTTGGVRLESPDRGTSSPELHASLTLDPATFRTGDDDHLFLSLSNGVALGLGPGSNLTVHTFRQSRFTAEKESTFYEPSISNTRLELNSGLIAIDCDHLSPLSELNLRLPFGEIRIHAARCVIEVDETSITIHSIQGHLTFYYPDSTKKEFFSSPRTIQITRSSAEVESVAAPPDDQNTMQAWDRYAAAVEYAAGRVLFRAAPDDAPFPAEPLLVVPQDYDEQPSPRPYQYRNPF